jgi:hypothetical protein
MSCIVFAIGLRFCGFESRRDGPDENLGEVAGIQQWASGTATERSQDCGRRSLTAHSSTVWWTDGMTQL